MTSVDEASEQEGIAIVGMAGRFPGAGDLDEFWANLCGGVESISFFSEQELAAAGVPAQEYAHPNYVRAGSEVAGVDTFDAEFFGYTAREAQIMDPQQRIFLESAWEALEHAGHDAKRYRGEIGVFAGSSTSSAYLGNVFSNLTAGAAIAGENVGLGVEVCFLTTRVSYKLDLRGPSIPVQTACSTGLVAVHTACQSLLNYECDMALSGASAFKSHPGKGYFAFGDAVLSPDGHCRPFDANARGTVFGSGVGVVVLKRLADAVADGDSVYAVIKGSAVNNDGAFKASFTAPSVAGQSAVIAEALTAADVDVNSVGYVEAHGTGTSLGDPIEVQALSKAFRGLGAVGSGFCRLGSLKSNIGHLDAASGIAGLLKVVLCVRAGVVPPTLHFERGNPEIDFGSSPFRVVRELEVWEEGAGPRRAGVSAFGFGGTNAHVVVEQAPVVVSGGVGRGSEVVVLSARSERALEVASDRLAGRLRDGSVGLADVAFTLACGRRGFPYRRVVVGSDVGEIAAALQSRDPAGVLNGKADGRTSGVVFLFSGQGGQYAGMGRGLYEAEPVFRGVVDRCAGELSAVMGVDVRDYLFAAEGSVEAEALVSRTDIAQPALFVLEYALVELWKSWGVTPTAMVGHSLGEYVAACVSGVFQLRDALKLVALRGQLMQEAAEGLMVSVAAERQVVESLLPAGLSLAAHNGPRDCVVAGAAEAVELFAELLAERGINVRRVVGSRAFHSALMDPVVGRLVEAVAAVRRGEPGVAFVSNVTGTWATAEVCEPEYWGRHARQGVEFWAGVAVAVGESDVVLEVGPGQTLSSAVRHGLRRPTQLVTASLPHRSDRRGALECAQRALSQLWLAGVELDWEAYFSGRGCRRVGLPTYPFERRRYWLEPQAPQAAVEPAASTVGHPLLDRVLVDTMGEMVFLTEFAIDRHWMLGEHQLLDAAILPGTTYLEMARRAAEVYAGSPVTEIADVDFLVPLMVPAEAVRTVHTRIRELPDGTLTFSVVSHDPGAEVGRRWIEHVRGRVGTAAVERARGVDLDELRARCALTTVDVERRQADHSVMTFGQRWQSGMRTVHVGQQAALGVLRLPEQHIAEDADYLLHPALLDLATGFSGFVVLGEDAAEQAAIDKRDLFLPVGYDRLTVHGPIPARAFSFATAYRGYEQTDQVRKIDVTICDESGVVAVEISGFTTKRVTDPEQTVRQLHRHARHHTLRWVPTGRVERTLTGRGSVLVIQDNESLAKPLVEEMRATGRTVVQARLAEETTELGAEDFLVTPDEAGFQQLLDRELDHVVYITASAGEHANHNLDGLGDCLDRGLHSMFRLAKVLARHQEPASKLTVVAPSVDRVTGEETSLAPAHAALFGLAKVIGQEVDGVQARCVDVAADTPAEILCDEVLASGTPGQVALRGNQRYVRELVGVTLTETDVPQPNYAYMITGGLGGLGLEMAKQLARSRPGARIALIGRRTLPPRQQWPEVTDPKRARQIGEIIALEAASATVRCYQGDVSDLADMRRVVAAARADLGRIGCVLHAAGVAGDGFLIRKEEQVFRATLAPKVFGALALDLVTAEDPPELMVLFGSTAAIFGPAGQSDYTAANMYLDGFAEYRNTAGRRTIVVDWTDWLDLGMAADHGVQPDQGFFRSVSIADGVRSFEEILTGEQSQVIVGEINYAAIGAMGPDLLAQMMSRAPVVASASIQGQIDAALRSAERPDTPAWETADTRTAVRLVGRDGGDYSATERHIAGIWARELDIEELNIFENSFDLGGNSLISLRIAQSIERTMGVRVRLADLFRYVTIAELAGFVDSKTSVG